MEEVFLLYRFHPLTTAEKQYLRQDGGWQDYINSAIETFPDYSSAEQKAEEISSPGNLYGIDKFFLKFESNG